MALKAAPLVCGEYEITSNHEELLFRQITPHLWVDEDGVPVAHAFGPASIDNGKPSYSRESVVTAQETFFWHNENAHSPSFGVWACSVGEVIGVGLRAIDDTKVSVDPPAAPGHCYVDFRGLSKSERKVLRTKLYWQAIDRGPLFPDSKTRAAHVHDYYRSGSIFGDI